MRLFEIKSSDGRTIDQVQALHTWTEIIGRSCYTFALHVSGNGHAVSEQQTGAIVCRLHTLYKGLPVSTKGLPLSRLKTIAQADLDTLLHKIGSDRFEATIKRALKMQAKGLKAAQAETTKEV